MGKLSDEEKSILYRIVKDTKQYYYKKDKPLEFSINRACEYHKYFDHYSPNITMIINGILDRDKIDFINLNIDEHFGVFSPDILIDDKYHFKKDMREEQWSDFGGKPTSVFEMINKEEYLLKFTNVLYGGNENQRNYILQCLSLYKILLNKPMKYFHDFVVGDRHEFNFPFIKTLTDQPNKIKVNFDVLNPIQLRNVINKIDTELQKEIDDLTKIKNNEQHKN